MKRFGSVTALAGVDLDVGRGVVKGLLGPNGAGKTTLLRVALGLLRPDAGEVRLFGVPGHEPRARRPVGYLPADPGFLPARSGRENLELLAALRDGDAPDRRDLATALGLSAADLDRPVRGYSSGMRQKLGLIQAFQHRPDLVVLDEPASRLDPIAHRAFEEIVRGAAADGRSVLLSSHTLPEVERCCDEIAMVRTGTVMLDATAREVTGHAVRRLTVRWSGAPRRIPPGLVDPQVSGSVLRAGLPPARLDALRSLLAEPTVEDVLVEAAGLDEVFHDLYSGRAAVPEDRPDAGAPEDRPDAGGGAP